jgi:hypothetical protein
LIRLARRARYVRARLSVEGSDRLDVPENLAVEQTS